MRILHVNPAPTWRGGERQVLLLASELAERGHDSPIVAAPGSVLLERARARDLPTEEVAMRGDLDFAAVSRVGRLMGDLRPNILHLHTARAHAVGGLAARMRGFRRTVVTRRLELPPRGPFGRFKYRMLGDHFVAISSAVEKSLVRGGVAPAKITRIPSALEPPPEAPARTGPSADGPFVVGTLAALTPQKDPECWVRTMNRVCEEDSSIRFVWAGDGELRRPTEVGVLEAGREDRVSFPGFLTDPETFWREIDLFLLPSAFEALGTVLLDALARGMPIVATEVGGIPGSVRDGREGLLAPAGDDEGLARAILAIRRNPDLHQSLGSSGRERSRDYEIRGLVDRILKVYEAVEIRDGGRSS